MLWMRKSIMNDPKFLYFDLLKKCLTGLIYAEAIENSNLQGQSLR